MLQVVHLADILSEIYLLILGEVRHHMTIQQECRIGLILMEEK